MENSTNKLDQIAQQFGCWHSLRSVHLKLPQICYEKPHSTAFRISQKSDDHNLLSTVFLYSYERTTIKHFKNNKKTT